MSDFDVSMRLKLDYKDRDANRAERDLKDIAKAANGLKRVGTDKLEKDLEQISRNARKAGNELQIPADKLRQLNNQRTDRAEAELNALKAAATQLGGKLALPAKRLRELNRLKTDRSEKELKELGNAAAKASQKLAKIDKTKFDHLNGEVDKSRRKVDNLGKHLNQHAAVNGPANRLGGVMGIVGKNATVAFGALAAFASVDNIIRGLNELEKSFNALDDAAARVAVTAEMLDPEVVKQIKANNALLSEKYGSKPNEVNAARNVFAAANYNVDRQNALLDPTVKTAFASSSAPETIARAVTAGINNLGLTEDMIPAFLDQIVKGGKEGEFEIEAMARYFPELGALYSASGRSGLDASAELIALAQMTRKGAGMEEGAATNLQNLLSKMAAPDTVKNFKKKGVDLKKLAASAKKSGTPYILALLDEVERLTGGDEFAIGELFGDMQAKSALRPLLKNRELYQKTFDAVRNKSVGVVDRDAAFLANTPKAQSDRRDAAIANSARPMGAFWGSIKNAFIDHALGWVNPDYRRREETRVEKNRLGSLDIEGLEADIADLKARIEARPKPQFDMPDVGRQTLELRLRDMEYELEQAKKVQGKDRAPETETPAGPKGPPVPRPKPKKLEKFGLLPENLEPAGKLAGAKFASALESEALKVGPLADDLKNRFSFTATPTISPRFTAAVNPGNSAGRATPSAGLATYHQTINGASDPHRTASLITRYQNRQMRTARARALHETGSYA